MSGWLGKNGPFLIAEIGGNHEGNFEYAKQLTELACRSGVDAVKFQIYSGESLVNRFESPERCAHFKKFELSREQYLTLYKICLKHHVTFTASVWDIDAINWIDPFMQFYKIGSGDFTAFPLLKKIAEKGKPMILSCGLTTMREIHQTVRFIQSIDTRFANPAYLALLQCTSMYPIPPKEANLAFMEKLKKSFGLTVGYSDHTIGNDAVEVAVAMRAEIIEMHFTDEREGKTFRDHKISFTLDEIKQLTGKIKLITTLQGSIHKRPTESEIESDHVTSFRRAVYPTRDLKAGAVLKENDLTVLRPNHGIDARDYMKVLGKQLRFDVAGLQPLNWDFFTG